MSGTIPDEFRKGAVRYSLLTDEPMEEIAKWLGITPSILEEWRSIFESSVEEDDETANLKQNLLADRFDREVLQPYAESLERLEALRIPLHPPSAADISNLVNAYEASEELASDIGRLTRLVSRFRQQVENIEEMGESVSKSAMFDAVIDMTRTGWSMKRIEPANEVISQQSSAPWGRFTVQLDIPPQQQNEDIVDTRNYFRVLQPFPELNDLAIAPALINEGILESREVEDDSSLEGGPIETGGDEND